MPTLNISLSKEVKAALEEISKRRGLKKSAMIAFLIMQEKEKREKEVMSP